MVLRIGKHGEFFGCSRFPDCQGTRSLAPAPPRYPFSRFMRVNVYLGVGMLILAALWYFLKMLF